MQQLSLFPDHETTSLMRRQLEALERIDRHPSSVTIGIDEVGMGAWAGPVTVAVVVLPKGWAHAEVTDSKKLTGKQREKALRTHVLPNALFHCVLSMPSVAVDRVGIKRARDCLTESVGWLARVRFPTALIVQDGKEDEVVPVDGSTHSIICLPKADALVPAVGAASILAKVTRDTHMKEMDKLHPGYGFANNVGYHSKTHKVFLEKNGPSPIHRRSYEPVKKVLEKFEKAASDREGSW
jgi:ribonuclease HII